MKRAGKFLVVFVFILAFLIAYASVAQVEEASEPQKESKEPRGGFKDEEIKDPRLEISSFFVGTSSCLYCHPNMKEDFLKNPHALSLRERIPLEKQGCEMCHGPGQKHMTTAPENIVRFDKETPLSYASLCLSCHKRVLTLSDWKKNLHSRVESKWCITCHEPHKTTRFLLKRDEEHLCASCHESVMNQIRAGASKHAVFDSAQLKCTSCHNPHRGDGSLLAKKTVSETCGQCHREKVGPFTFEHISEDLPGTSSCLTCHNPHGSPNTALLTMNGRGLCLSCHQDKIIHKQGLTCFSAGCHTEIHGSNTTPIFLRQ